MCMASVWSEVLIFSFEFNKRSSNQINADGSDDITTTLDVIYVWFREVFKSNKCGWFRRHKYTAGCDICVISWYVCAHAYRNIIYKFTACLIPQRRAANLNRVRESKPLCGISIAWISLRWCYVITTEWDMFMLSVKIPFLCDLDNVCMVCGGKSECILHEVFLHTRTR